MRFVRVHEHTSADFGGIEFDVRKSARFLRRFYERATDLRVRVVQIDKDLFSLLAFARIIDEHVGKTVDSRISHFVLLSNLHFLYYIPHNRTSQRFFPKFCNLSLYFVAFSQKKIYNKNNEFSRRILSCP